MVDREAALRELSYDPETGVFRWKVSRRGVKCGSIAGCVTRNGYTLITLLGDQYMAHRLAWLVYYGQWPKAHIDHINGRRSENQIANLREATTAENAQAIFNPRGKTATGIRGVSICRGRFKVRICCNGKYTNLGTFETAEQARTAYLEAKERLHPHSRAAKPHFI